MRSLGPEWGFKRKDFDPQDFKRKKLQPALDVVGQICGVHSSDITARIGGIPLVVEGYSGLVSSEKGITYDATENILRVRPGLVNHYGLGCELGSWVYNRMNVGIARSLAEVETLRQESMMPGGRRPGVDRKNELQARYERLFFLTSVVAEHIGAQYALANNGKIPVDEALSQGGSLGFLKKKDQGRPSSTKAMSPRRGAQSVARITHIRNLARCFMFRGAIAQGADYMAGTFPDIFAAGTSGEAFRLLERVEPGLNATLDEIF